MAETRGVGYKTVASEFLQSYFKSTIQTHSFTQSFLPPSFQIFGRIALTYSKRNFPMTCSVRLPVGWFVGHLVGLYVIIWILGQHLAGSSTNFSPKKKGFQLLKAFFCFTSHWINPMQRYSHALTCYE